MNPETSRYSNWQLIKDLKHFIKPYKGKFWLGTILRVTSDIVWLFPIWAFGEIITFATEYQVGDSTRYFWILISLVALSSIYHFITQDLAKYQIYQLSEKISIDAWIKTLNHLFSLNAIWHEKENTGNKMRRIDRGSEGMDRIVRMYVDLVIESTINLIGISVIFYTLSWQHNILLLFFFVTYFLISLKLTQKAKKQSLIANIEWEKFTGSSFEGVNNISTVKSLGIGSRLIRYIKKMSKILFEEVRKRIVRYRIRIVSLHLYQEIFRQTILIYTVIMVLQGKLEIGIIASVLLYFGKMTESAGELAEVANNFEIDKIAIMRMKDILNESPSIELSGSKKFKKDWERLEIKNLHFSYKGRKVLKNFSLTINRGQKIGIVGLSGAGKSTLFKLLLKLYDGYEGDILFDQTPLSDIKRSSFLKHIAIVPQETELFNLSLKENVTLENRLNKDQQKQLETALKVAHVKDFAYKLDDGIESKIGEKGIKLSGGEKQRVGIARAVYRHPDLLLLDEATSHLDVESEKKIQDALHQFFQKTTAIVIAHRLSTIKEMDRIVVIKNGSVLEEGSFSQLMKLKGEFFKLWERQKF